jgi:farnesol dehydrogenase
MSMILVTGATGFIGTHVVEQLLAEGRRVRVFVRRPELLAPATRARVEVTRGDLVETGIPRRAFDGVESVIHLAAFARAWCRDPHDFTAVNVDAVARLLEECDRRGVRRVVHVSSVTAAGVPGATGNAKRALTPYAISKWEGERVVADYVATGGDAVIVRPTRVYGPGPLTDANATTRMIDLYLTGRFRFRLADGGALASYVHVADVAAGMLLAERRGQRGGNYFLGGENISLLGFLERAGRLVGVRHATVELPAALALAVGGAAELWGRLGGSAFITRAWVRFFLEDQRVDLEPTRRDLGYEPRPLDEGLAQTIAWLGYGKGGVRHEADRRSAARAATQA